MGHFESNPSRSRWPDHLRSYFDLIAQDAQPVEGLPILVCFRGDLPWLDKIQSSR